jgi:hypothetical protein
VICAARRNLAHGIRDLLLGQRIERRGGLVEDQQARLAHQRPRDRQPLLLAARQLHAALADHRVQPLGRALPAGTRTSAWRIAATISSSVASGFTKLHVLADRAREQMVSCVTKPICRRARL